MTASRGIGVRHPGRLATDIAAIVINRYLGTIELPANSLDARHNIPRSELIKETLN
jgi:hypothetical protein